MVIRFEARERGRRQKTDARKLPVSLALLDGFSLRVGGRPVAFPMSAQRLVSFLALHDRSMLRVYVAGSLWSETREEHAAANLRSTVWRVQHACAGLIDATRSHLRLGRGVTVDLHRMVAQASRLIDPAAEAEAQDLDPSPLTADLLPDWYDEWVVLERERLRQLRLHALESLCRRLTVAARFGEAIQAGLSAVAAEPLRESARRILIQAHLAEGNWGEAIRQYTAYRRLLFDELGMDPSPQMDALVRELSV